MKVEELKTESGIEPLPDVYELKQEVRYLVVIPGGTQDSANKMQEVLTKRGFPPCVVVSGAEVRVYAMS